MLKSDFDSDVGIRINNGKVLRERCHQTEYIYVAQTQFHCGNIKRNCFKNLLKKASLLTALMMLKLPLNTGPPISRVKLFYCLCYLVYF